MSAAGGSAVPTLRQALPVWWQIGLLSFGGPAAQIALMHRVLVEERRWLSEPDYLNALSFCMLLPGPEAMQLATYAGWRMHGTRGGLIAGLLFVLPGAAVILALSFAYALFGAVPLTAALFTGVKAAVLVIVLQALIRVAGRSLKSRLHRILAGLSFLSLFAFAVPFPAVILAAGITGWLLSGQAGTEATDAEPVSPGSTVRTVLTWLAIWWLPVLAIGPVTGIPLLSELGLFFSQLATLTFGGAYAVLAWMAQEAVQTKGWLTTEEMIDGLGLAETTPGPLILVTEFTGFLAGARSGPDISLTTGLAAAAITLWATFAPCFLWVFAGAPYVSWLTAKPRLRGALQAISAAVVGVILNLSLWFAMHVLFTRVGTVRAGPFHMQFPGLSAPDLMAFALMTLAAILLLRLKLSVLLTLFICAAASGLWFALMMT